MGCAFKAAAVLVFFLIVAVMAMLAMKIRSLDKMIDDMEHHSLNMAMSDQRDSHDDKV